MYDDRCLVDLINKRFDDVIGQVASLKADMLRESQSLKNGLAINEQEIEDLKKIRWMVLGGASAAFVIVQAGTEVLKYYLK